ncbi:hypothetical protein, unlikely [Trypanosoma brucei gambiense DAL972]|uniref:Uncharacterized protein n=1 Tax=Trypanosoma brucei gambiense (strain MHOM/CI/86/DAL972) TaxID=679716 RepID=C9ZPN8_TRYB9|nr:hypothetical protein, unlikely [Trypanosoma brucei gambiense DAL972]CBH11366.1 hypothetical protein, unlikely [Trypanosoma brucei gambiense DAL972]|eukprot:XP_011773653.1 hypothetical protein, unlikely [Trypanosoma brucei gambiense DAL972]
MRCRLCGRVYLPLICFFFFENKMKWKDETKKRILQTDDKQQNNNGSCSQTQKNTINKRMFKCVRVCERERGGEMEKVNVRRKNVNGVMSKGIMNASMRGFIIIIIIYLLIYFGCND